jgi:6-phosphogluconolactonase
MRRTRFRLVVALLTLAGCSEREVTAPDVTTTTDALAATRGGHGGGAVYVMTNAAANAVLAYERGPDGSLSEPVSFATGGAGTGAGLGSQGALVLTGNGRWLLAVNAGSDELSVFLVTSKGLFLTDRASTGGDMPISVTEHRGVVYVLNAGGDGGITGFRLLPWGRLWPIHGSKQPLSGAGTGPAQVEFTPDGDFLVVTEKMTNSILTYAVDGRGAASRPRVQASAGETPFGFAFAGRDLLVVSEAFGGAPDASATSSYDIGRHGTLRAISASVGTTETAACWTVVSKNGKYAYVTNTGSGTVTGYEIGRSGSLSLLDADGVTGVTGPGSAPIDADFSGNGRFLYVLNGGNGTISGFSVDSDGSLEPAGGATGLPAGAVGIAAR